MKKLLIIITVGLLSMLGTSQAQIQSQNAVGYVKFTANPGGFLYISNPFEHLAGGATTLQGLLNEVVPVQSQIFKWDDVSQTYIPITKVSDTLWVPDLPVSLNRGEGHLIRVADTAPAAIDIYLYGEVPGATSEPSTNLNLVQGFNSISYPYPGEITIENSGLNDVLEVQDQVFVWNNDTQNYNVVTKVSNTLYIPSNVTLKPGHGFLVSKSAGGVYQETVPYSWPNN